MSQRKSSTGNNKPYSSFIVSLWSTIFYLLRFVSLLTIIRKAFPSIFKSGYGYVVVEVWVIIHTVLAMVAAITVYLHPENVVATIFLIYGALRIFEIVVVQVNILLFDEFRARKAGKPYSIRGYRRIVLLLLHNYAEIVFWFTGTLMFLHHASHLEIDNFSLATAFRQGILQMASFSSRELHPVDLYASLVLLLQTVVGIFMTILTLARFVSLMPAPLTQEPYERPSQQEE